MRNSLNLFSYYFANYMGFYLHALTDTGISASITRLSTWVRYTDESEKAITRLTEILGPYYSVSFHLKYTGDRTVYLIEVTPQSMEDAARAWDMYANHNQISERDELRNPRLPSEF